MAFCMQCGNQLNEGSAFCGKCCAKVYTGATQSHPTNNGFFNQLNSTVKKAMNGAQKVVSDISGSQSANTSSNNTSHTMYEVFTPALGLGKKFIFTENFAEPQKIVDLMCNCENYRKICEGPEWKKCINEVVQIMTKG